MSAAVAEEEPVTFDFAARKIGIDRARLRTLSIERGIAIHWGGTAEHPRLKVLLSKARAMILSELYVPPAAGASKRQAPKRPSSHAMRRRAALHPDVKC